MLETWIYMMIDKAFFMSNGHEYAAVLGEDDVKLCGSYDDAIHFLEIRQHCYRRHCYYLTKSGTGTAGDDLLYWCRVEDNEGHAHVFEVRKMVVYGDLFQVHHR